ncbi:MAG: MoaD/ThiS family protein [Chloroflexia bacterium]
MIRVEVRLYATLRKYAPPAPPGTPLSLELPAGTRLGELFARLGIPPEELKTAFVNNRRQEEGYLLRDGDRVALFPPVAGG